MPEQERSDTIVPAPPHAEPRSWLGTFAGVLKAIVLIAAALSFPGVLFGYGVAFGLSHALGGDTSAWYSSILDLFALAGLGITTLITATADMQVLGPIIWDAGKSSALTLAGYAVAGWLGFAIVRAVSKRFGVRASVTQEPPLASVQEPPLVRWWRRTRYEYLVPITVSGAGAIGFVMPLFVIVLFTILATALAVLPLVGIGAGNAYAQKWVVGPSQCLYGPKARNIARQEYAKLSDPKPTPQPGFACVEVVKTGGDRVATGVLVFTRSGTTPILYRPAEDDLQVISLNDMYMRTITSLPGRPAPPASSLASAPQATAPVIGTPVTQVSVGQLPPTLPASASSR